MGRRGNIIKLPGQSQRCEFVELFKEISAGGKYSDWSVWQDFIYMSAISMSNCFDRRQDREDEYLRLIGKYGKQEQMLLPQMLAKLAEAFEEEKFGDILGDMYMQLEMNNHWHGQFFTPYNVSLMMAKMTIGDTQKTVEKKGYITVSDPCCGAGGLLIGAAEAIYEAGVNYQQTALFIAQDIDRVVAMMCYIQMSLLGMAGYVIVGNTLTADYENCEYWYTPMYFSDVWQLRWMTRNIQDLLHSDFTKFKPISEPPAIAFKQTESGQLMFG